MQKNVYIINHVSVEDAYCRKILNIFLGAFKTGKKSEPLAIFLGLFFSEYKINPFFFSRMYVYSVYSAMWKSTKPLPKLSGKSRNKHHSNHFQMCPLSWPPLYESSTRNAAMKVQIFNWPLIFTNNISRKKVAMKLLECKITTSVYV